MTGTLDPPLALSFSVSTSFNGETVVIARRTTEGAGPPCAEELRLIIGGKALCSEAALKKRPLKASGARRTHLEAVMLALC